MCSATEYVINNVHIHWKLYSHISCRNKEKFTSFKPLGIEIQPLTGQMLRIPNIGDDCWIMGHDRDQWHNQDAEGTLFVKAYVGCDSILDTKWLLSGTASVLRSSITPLCEAMWLERCHSCVLLELAVQICKEWFWDHMVAAQSKRGSWCCRVEISTQKTLFQWVCHCYSRLQNSPRTILKGSCPRSVFSCHLHLVQCTCAREELSLSMGW